MSTSMSITRPVSSTPLLSRNGSLDSPKYIPIHRRLPSNGASVASSSRPSSPKLGVKRTSSETTSVNKPGVYSIDSLLALRPLADNSIKEKLRESLPEIVMSGRQKKSIRYYSTHPPTNAKSQPKPKQDSEFLTPAPTQVAVSLKRSLPRRNRPGRGSDRRRSVLQDQWQGMRITTRQPLMVLS